jgi:hypothetical protein
LLVWLHIRLQRKILAVAPAAYTDAYTDACTAFVQHFVRIRPILQQEFRNLCVFVQNTSVERPVPSVWMDLAGGLHVRL